MVKRGKILYLESIAVKIFFVFLFRCIFKQMLMLSETISMTVILTENCTVYQPYTSQVMIPFRKVGLISFIILSVPPIFARPYNKMYRSINTEMIGHVLM